MKLPFAVMRIYGIFVLEPWSFLWFDLAIDMNIKFTQYMEGNIPYIVRKEKAQKLEASTLFDKNEKVRISLPIDSPVSKNLTGGFTRLKSGYVKDFVYPRD